MPETEALVALGRLEFLLTFHSSLTERLWLPYLFAQALDRQAPPDIMICEASSDQPWWKVDTVVDDRRHASFMAGWPEFVQAYNLKLYNKLLFRYDGRHRFSVKVFDYGGYRVCYEDWVEGYGAVRVECDVAVE